MKFFQPASCEVVPKNQLGIMLLRGVAGLGLMAWSFTLLQTRPLAGFTVMGVAVLLLKGCPACWGMHMVHAVRSASRKKTPAAPAPTEEPDPPRRPYRPRDMAEHLFPPEDVARFRQMRQADDTAAMPGQENSHVR